MLLPLLLLSFAPAEAPLLATVPEDAYVLAQCRDFAALRARAERNDWYCLLGSSHGEPLLDELVGDLRHHTHSDVDPLLELAEALEGEVVFFATRTVAGFVTEPGADRALLTERMRAWMPGGDTPARRTLELAGGGTVELVAWPDEIDGWSGRAGHFAAFVDHPRALALYSGDDSAAVMAALTEGVARLGAEQRAPLVSSYQASGGGKGGGIELFVDFTPMIEQAEAALKEAAEGVLPDPTRLLGLEGGTWLHASADVFPGTRIDCQARLRLPPDTNAARLADTFRPLPHSLPADLPGGVWALWALNWNIPSFYQRARAAFEDAGLADGFAEVDGALEFAQGASGVDPVDDVLNQLAGDFALYVVHPAHGEGDVPSGETDIWRLLGFQAGLVDGDVFRSAFDKLIGVGGLGSIFAQEQIAGVDAYLAREDPGHGAGGSDGGVAFLPRAATLAPARSVLERALRALTRAEGASLLDGSQMQAAIDESAGACFLWCVEMTPVRAYLLPELEDLRLPPLEEGQPARDPFDSQLISTVRRTPEGFELRLQAR